MTKTLRLLGLAALLTTGAATATMAASGEGADGSQAVTGTMTGSQQVGTPATDNTVTTTNGQYTTGTPSSSNPSSSNIDPRKGSSGTGISAQSTGPQYPSVVGPTGSVQQDATNPNRSPPTGGTSEGGGSGSGGNSR